MTFVWSSLINHCSHPVIEGHQIRHCLRLLMLGWIVSDPLIVCAVTLPPWGSAPWSSKTEVRLNGIYFLRSAFPLFFNRSDVSFFPVTRDFTWLPFSNIMRVVYLCYCRIFGTGTVQSANWIIKWWSVSFLRNFPNFHFDCSSCMVFFIHWSWHS